MMIGDDLSLFICHQLPFCLKMMLKIVFLKLKWWLLMKKSDKWKKQILSYFLNNDNKKDISSKSKNDGYVFV